MAPRTGRPKTENPITKQLSVRLDQETETLLLKYCKENNVSKGGAIRKGVHLLLQKK